MSDGKRKLFWLKTRSSKVFSSEHCKELVKIAQTHTPSSTYDETYVLTGDAKTAKACRFLAMIKRDYGFVAFKKFASSKIKSPRSTSTDKTKGVETMSKQKPKTKKGKSKETSSSVEAGKTPSLPLKHLAYKASVNGAFARVKCVQEFGNDAQNPVEAIYVFPMPDEATVTRCTMLIGKKKVEAELKKRREARMEYEDAIAAGHHASLLEQERPNIFTMSVGGIEPGEKISVEVDYVQRIPWQAGGGRFTIPLVVAPRFIPGIPREGKPERGFSPDTDAVSDAHRITPKVAKEGVPYNADISVLFSPGFRCELYCPSHPTIIPGRTVGKGQEAELKTGDILTDRDFTLVYKSLSKVPEVSVHTGTFKDESFVLANIIPPGDVAPIGSDVVLVLDCSGSMSGAKIEGLKVIGKKIVNNLKKQNAGDNVGIVPFDNGPWPEHPISPISEATEKFIDSLHARGGTCLGFALQKAEEMLSKSRRPGVILMVTDGDTEHARGWYGNGIRLIAVGIDTAVNDTLIKELTRRNFGTAEFVYPGEDYDAVANRLAGYLSGPVLKDVVVKANGEAVGISDVFQGRPASIAVRFAKKAGEVKITGKNPEDKEISWTINPADGKECDFIAQIWAREFIRENQDERKQTEASLKYGIICKHTSFVAVSLKEVPGKAPERVEIPVNLPAGWDYESVFGSGKGLAGLVFAGFDASAFGAVKGSVGASLRMRRALLSSCDTGGAKMVRYRMDSIGALGDEELPTPPVPPIPGIPPVRPTPRIPPIPVPPTPGIPPVPPPAPAVSTRFTLDAKDLVDRMIGILTALGQGKREEAEKAFNELKKELTPSVAGKLDSEKKAEAYYFALRLASYGLKLDEGVIAKLRFEPKSGDALSWFNLAKKEEGRPYTPVIPTGDAADFVAWKFGRAEKPATGDWALVR